jgi:cation:H+ antiporter
MLVNTLLLLGGCVLLYFGAEWLVRGAAIIAEALGIPKSVVGLTLVAFGTSAPELVVNLIAGYEGQTDIALANVSGSNLTNICVGFGLCGVISGVAIKSSAFRDDLVMLILSAAMILGFLLLNLDRPQVPLWSAAPLMVVLGFYLISLRRRTGSWRENREGDHSTRTLLLHFGIFLAGVASLYGGGRMVLNGAVAIAEFFRISDALIGLTIIAAGTSIPDTLASVIAARRGQHELAVGNILGSNISNILVVLTGTILSSWIGGHPSKNGEPPLPPGSLGADHNIVLDYVAVCLVSLIFIALASFAGRVRRPAGIILLILYVGYMGTRVSIEWMAR